MPTTAITRPSRFGPASWARIVWASGISMPPPNPCRTRNAIRLLGDHASPHSTEPAMNIRSDATQLARAPKRSIAQPVIGIETVSASR